MSVDTGLLSSNSENNYQAVLAVLNDFLEAQAAGTPLAVEALTSLHPTLHDLTPTLLELSHILSAWYSQPRRRRRGASKTRIEPSTPRPKRAQLRYRLHEVLGFGAFGVVFRATDTVENRPAAIKVRYPRDNIFDFKRGFRLPCGLADKHLVTHYELIQRPVFGIVMELVNGETLRTFARRSFDGLDGLRVIRNVFSQITQGVASLHSQRLVHRDLKPTNVMVTTSGEVVILDFGLVTPASSLSMYQSKPDNLIKGTLAYMSPEQMLGKKATPSSDWYSVGVMLFEALTGHLPFDGNFAQLLHRKQRGEFTHALPSGTATAELRMLCEELLAPLPKARPDVERIISLLGEPSTERAIPKNIDDEVFIGRREPMAELYAAVSQSRRAPQVVFVGGPPGIGKTALISYFLRKLEDADQAFVFRGRCFEGDNVDYPGVDSFVDQLRCFLMNDNHVERFRPASPHLEYHLTQVFPVLQDVFQRAATDSLFCETPNKLEQRRRAILGLREVLSRIAHAKSLVIHLDDMQWADIDTAELIADVLAAPEHIGAPTAPNLLLLVSYNRDDARGIVALKRHLKRHRLVNQTLIDVEPFTDADSVKLAQAFGVTDAQRAALIAQDSRGNPFLIRLLARRACNAEGHLNLDALIANEVERLPLETQQLFRVICVAGQPIELFLLNDILRMGNNLHRSVELLRNFPFVRTWRRNGYRVVEPFHDRIRKSVVDNLGEAASSQWHGKLAKALEKANGIHPAFIAYHFSHNGDWRKAQMYYHEAGKLADSKKAYDKAATYYLQALKLSDDSSPVDGIQEQLANALANSGKGKAAAEMYLQCAVAADPHTQVRRRHRAMWQYLISGHMSEGLATLEEALTRFRLHVPRRRATMALCMLARRAALKFRRSLPLANDSHLDENTVERLELFWSASTGLMNYDPLTSMYYHSHFLAASYRSRSVTHLCRARLLDAIFISLLGSRYTKRVNKLLGNVEELQARIQDKGGKAHVLALSILASAFLHYFLGRPRDALERFRESEHVLKNECSGVRWELDVISFYINWCLYLSGQLGKLATRLPQLQKEAEDRNNLFLSISIASPAGLISWLAADELEEARRVSQDTISKWPTQGFYIQHLFALMGQTQLELYAGDGARAWETMQEKWASYQRSLFGNVQAVRVFMWYLHGCSALAAASAAVPPRERESLLKHVERDAKYIKALRLEWATPWGDSLIGAMLVQRGQINKARAILASTEQLLDTYQSNLLAMGVRRNLAELIPGEEGKRRVESIDAEMTKEGIKNPARMAQFLLPVIPPRNNQR